jgi:hypothetical protein
LLVWAIFLREVKKMYFRDDRHRDIFLALRQKAGVGKDCEYDSALYVLSALGKSVIPNYIDLATIKMRALKRVAAPWSSSEKALVNLAAALFGAGKADLSDVFWHLDEENTRVALQALEIRYLMR